jgi:excisionase family DNA binding protein
MEQADLLLVEEVAPLLRRTKNGVYWLIKSGQLRAAKLGGRVVVRRADLDKFVSDAFAEVS